MSENERALEVPAASSLPALVEKVESIELGSPVVVSLAAPTASPGDVSVSLVCVGDPSSSVEGEVVGNGVGVFNISVSPRVRGRHRLIVKVKGKEIEGSPFPVFVKLPPSQLGKSGYREIGRLYKIWGMHINNKGQLMVIETGIDPPLVLRNKRRVVIMERDSSRVGFIECDKFGGPTAISQAADGVIFIADSGMSTNCLFKFSSEGELLHCGEYGLFDNKDSFPPFNVALKIINNQIYVLDDNVNLVKIFDTDCKLLGSIDVKESGMPTDIAQGPDGLYVAGYGIYVYECAPSGALIRKLSTPDYNFRGIGFDPCGYIVASVVEKGVHVFTPGGECVGLVTSEFQDPELENGIPFVEEPGRLAIDKDGYVYIHSFRSSTHVYVL